jgi:hypothetical protein
MKFIKKLISHELFIFEAAGLTFFLFCIVPMIYTIEQICWRFCE